MRVPIISSEEERQPIATDGFVTITGTYLSDSSDLELPLVRATDEVGEEIPGRLSVLRREDSLVHLGWEAEAPLVVGALVTLTFSGDDESGAGGAGSVTSGKTVELEVVGEPTPLPVPTATLDAWLEMRHGVGELVECETYDSCGSSVLEVPTDEVRLPAVSVSWRLPPIVGVVAWEVWAETSDAQDGALPLRPARHQLIDREREVIPAVSQVVAFSDDAAEHCAVVVVKDLRSGDEARSEVICDEPGAPDAVLVDHLLSACDEPPTADSLTLWCEGRPNDARCADLVPEGLSGQGGMGGQGDSIDNAGAGGQSEAQAVEAIDESDGCACAARPGPSWAGSTALGLLLLIARLRRRPAKA